MARSRERGFTLMEVMLALSLFAIAVGSLPTVLITNARANALARRLTTAAGFAQDEIAPRAEQIDRTNTFPRDLWPRMGSLGLHGITVEEEFGGSGLGYLAHCVAMEEVSRGSAAVGLSSRGRHARAPACGSRASCRRGCPRRRYADEGGDIRQRPAARRFRPPGACPPARAGK